MNEMELTLQTPPIFIYENNRKSNKIMHCFLFSFFQLKLLALLRFQLSSDGGGVEFAHNR